MNSEFRKLSRIEDEHDRLTVERDSSQVPIQENIPLSEIIGSEKCHDHPGNMLTYNWEQSKTWLQPLKILFTNESSVIGKLMRPIFRWFLEQKLMFDRIFKWRLRNFFQLLRQNLKLNVRPYITALSTCTCKEFLIIVICKLLNNQMTFCNA